MAVDKLVDSTQLDSDLTSVANAIRAKSGGSSQLAFPAGFVSEIGNIPSGASWGTTVSASNKMVIPKVSGKTSFFAYVEGEDPATYFTAGGRAIFACRLAWISTTTVYSVKSTNTNIPPAIQGGQHPTVYVTDSSSSVTVNFPNANTSGLLPNGETIKYIWF